MGTVVIGLLQISLSLFNKCYLHSSQVFVIINTAINMIPWSFYGGIIVPRDFVIVTSMFIFNYVIICVRAGKRFMNSAHFSTGRKKKTELY